MKEGEYERKGTVKMRNGQPTWWPFAEGELKSCPCCGGGADVKTVDGWSQIYCEDCGLNTPYGRTNTWDGARDIWNRRAIEQEAEAVQ